jgi:hypothetical protein
MRLTQIPVLYALLTLSHWVLAQDDTHVYMAGSPGVHNVSPAFAFQLYSNLGSRFPNTVGTFYSGRAVS